MIDLGLIYRHNIKLLSCFSLIYFAPGTREFKGIFLFWRSGTGFLMMLVRGTGDRNRLSLVTAIIKGLYRKDELVFFNLRLDVI